VPTTTKRSRVVCGVDIGSTNVKVIAIDPDGTVRARTSRPTPRDTDGLSIDGRSLFDVVETLILEACGDTFEAQALCTVGVGEDGLLADADLRPVTPALAWFDPRRQAVLSRLRPHLAESATFDTSSDAACTFVGWAWASQQPGAALARTWVAIADLPAVLWSGQRFMSDTLASRTGAWHASSRTWAHDRVALTLGASQLLPEVLATGAALGHVQSPRFKAGGVLSPDALCVVGGHDHPVGGWGVDQMTPGAILDSMGTAEVVVVQTPSPPSSRHNQVDIAPGIRSSGTTLLRVEELSRNVAWAARDPQVAECIADLLADTSTLVPVLEAGYFRPGTRGGGTPSYAPETPRDPLVRASAVLGALAAVGRDAVHAVAGSEIQHRSVRLAGGWARSPGWLAIKESVNGYPTVPIAEPEVTAVGAALLAANAVGWEPDPEKALGGAPSAA
jgi:sugar (pentulose or hexulose) kinase